jgi:hypothetical protein
MSGGHTGNTGCPTSAPHETGTTMDDLAKRRLLSPGLAVTGMLGALVVVIELAKHGA